MFQLWSVSRTILKLLLLPFGFMARIRVEIKAVRKPTSPTAKVSLFDEPLGVSEYLKPLHAMPTKNEF